MESLRSSTPPLFFIRHGEPVRPVKCEIDKLPRDGRPHHVLTRVETFQRAALDSVAFVSWFTLTFKGWELALEEWQVELVRNCAFREREVKGGCGQRTKWI